MKVIGLVLAAGQGTRMKSKLSKVMHPICGKPMIGHVLDTLEQLNTDRNVVIIGHDAQTVQDYIGERASFALQAEQLGTGHAVMQAEQLLKDEEGMTIILCGDTPLIQASSLNQLLALHKQSGAAGTILTARLDDPFGYGRIVRDEEGDVARIVEQKDCTADEAAIQEINTGTFCFDNRKLFAALQQVNNHNAQQEYYLTDVIGILQKQGDKIQAHCLEDERESIGINDRVMLAEAERTLRERINTMHMQNGVTLIDPERTYIDAEVKIGMDTVIYPGASISGQTIIGEGCVIGPNCDIIGSTIQDRSEIRHSVLRDAHIGCDTNVGPYAHLRPGARIGNDVRIGDFVEIKNAAIGDQTTIAHLSYVGDAHVGKQVNIGCGAITVNYDGYNKHHTEIEDGAFIGSNVNLIAPIKVGKDAFVVAGSTITNDVEGNSLAIARVKQTNKPEYADKIRQRIKARRSKDE